MVETPTSAAAAAPYREEAFQRVARPWERTVEVVLFLSAFLAVIVTVGIFLVLAANSLEFFREVSVFEFLFETEWNPDHAPTSWGVLPLVTGTLLVTIGSSIIAVPLGLATAIYLSEYAPLRLRAIIKPVLEILAGIPSIVFGIFAVLVISPVMQARFDADVFNAANAIVVLSFMVLPIVTSLSEDALRAVPQHFRHGALALGATRWETTKQVVLPAAMSGIFASILLGFSRAVGETMAVVLAAGRTPNMTWNIFESIETMTAFIAATAQGDVAHEGPRYFALFAVGLLLFLITFFFNWLSARVIHRYREAY